MAYTTPLKVFRSMERIQEAEETFESVSSGDTVQLANQYIIKDSETVTLDGNTVADGDYTVNLEENSVTYTGTGTGELDVDYGFGPYNSKTVEDKIASVEQYIDDFTNSTYDGLATVTDEYYNGAGRDTDIYPFTKRPVRSVDTVEVNQANASNNPNYVSLTEGLGEDYVKHQDLGIRFLEYGTAPNDDVRDLKVGYDYGYKDVPADLGQAATEMVIDDLVRGTVSGAMVDGRDNFDPQTVDVQKNEYMPVLERYRIERLENVVELAEEGQIS